jgi:hypothetical protein
MRHIIHTLLLGLRLIIAANSAGKEGNIVDSWSRNLNTHKVELATTDPGPQRRSMAIPVNGVVLEVQFT